jgi:transcriptional antiterminator RfaH
MDAPWYVLHSKPRKEEFLLDQLRLSGFEAYCPHVRVLTVNPRARKIRPYFPGYVFLQADLGKNKASSLQWMPGATGFVSFDGIPARVPDGLIPILRQRVDEVNASGGELLHELKSGDQVRVVEGPFAGYEAIFDVRLPGTERVRVLLKLLQQRRQLPVELDAGQIKKMMKR